MGIICSEIGEVNWKPDQFSYELWGCRMGLRFPVIKLEDYNEREVDLEANDSPFATVVLAHLRTRSTRADPQSRLQWKTRLVRSLYASGRQRQDILELFRFIDWLMVLPDELANRFLETHWQYEEELQMRYVTSVERIGMKKGFEKGLEQGVQQGIKRGECAVLRRLLLQRFSSLPEWAEERLEQAEPEDLERWTGRLLDAPSLKDVFN